MELGQRLKQARLEAGLSQRQLCGEEITRNMLSQIENGSARPSMDTLRYLAARLGKSISYFLEEEAVTSPNQNLIARARSASAPEVLELLKAYHSPDDVFDPERYLLETLACLTLAQAAIEDDRPGYAASLLEQAVQAGSQTPYYTEDLERRRLLLCFAAGVGNAAQLTQRLPDNTQELMLRSAAAMEAGDPFHSGQLLDAAPHRDEAWYFRRAEAFFAHEDFALAAQHYRQAESYDPPRVYARLEHCYRELEDYKMAYHYACKQR